MSIEYPHIIEQTDSTVVVYASRPTPQHTRTRRIAQSWPYASIEGVRSGDNLEVVARLVPGAAVPLPVAATVEVWAQPSGVPVPWTDPDVLAGDLQYVTGGFGVEGLSTGISRVDGVGTWITAVVSGSPSARHVCVFIPDGGGVPFRVVDKPVAAGRWEDFAVRSLQSRNGAGAVTHWVSTDQPGFGLPRRLLWETPSASSTAYTGGEECRIANDRWGTAYEAGTLTLIEFQAALPPVGSQLIERHSGPVGTFFDGGVMVDWDGTVYGLERFSEITYPPGSFPVTLSQFWRLTWTGDVWAADRYGPKIPVTSFEFWSVSGGAIASLRLEPGAGLPNDRAPRWNLLASPAAAWSIVETGFVCPPIPGTASFCGVYRDGQIFIHAL